MPTGSMTVNNLSFSTDGGETWTSLGDVKDGIELNPERVDENAWIFKGPYKEEHCLEFQSNLTWKQKLNLLIEVGYFWGWTEKEFKGFLHYTAPNNWLKRHGIPMRRR